MKKRKILLMLSLVLCLIASLALIGCDGCDKEETNASVNVAPEITVVDDGIYWASVQDAEQYLYKFNNEEWKTAENKIEFPQTEGEYTLHLKTIDAEEIEGMTTELKFKVAKLTASCTNVDNSLVFEGERIYYSVNGGEEGELRATKILDFSVAPVGSEYTVRYYAKGAFWEEEISTYYLNSDIQTANLTVKPTIVAPNLVVNSEKTGITWAECSNATGYVASINDQPIELTGTSIDFPKEVGEYTISVQAVNDAGSFVSSSVSEFSYVAEKKDVPNISYDTATECLCWANEYNSLMQKSTDGVNFTAVNANSVATTDIQMIKLARHYDENTRTLYLESKPIQIVKNTVSDLAFSLDGYADWQTDTPNAKFYVSVSKTATDEFSLSYINNKNLTFLQEAGSYTLKVKGADIIDNSGDIIKFYIPDNTEELQFNVLEKPQLTYSEGKLEWQVDSNATKYEYKKSGETTWTTATNSGYAEVSEMTSYEVRAIGSETAGSYALNSSVSSLYFDPTCKSDITTKTKTLANFDNASYMQNLSKNVPNGTTSGSYEIITSANASAEEQTILQGASGGMVKVVSGSARQFEAHWGSKDGFVFNLFQGFTIGFGDKLVFKVYIASNDERASAGYEGFFSLGASGVKKETSTDNYASEWHDNKETNFPALEVNKWIEVSIDLNNFAKKLVEINSVWAQFLYNGQEGDVFYVDEIRYEYTSVYKYDSPSSDGGITTWTEATATPSFLANGAEGASTFEIIGADWMHEKDRISVYHGEDSVGEYIQFNISGNSSWDKDAVKFNFTDITLNEGDQVYIHTFLPNECKKYPKILVNGEDTGKFLTYEGQGATEGNTGHSGFYEGAVYTASADGEALNTLTINVPKGEISLFTMRVYSVYIVRAS